MAAVAGRRSAPSPGPESGRPPRWSLLLAIITGSNLFTEPYLLTGGGGPNGASASPVLIMYQTGIQQGDAGAGAAIGVMLVIFVAVLTLLVRRISEGSGK